MKRFLLFLLLLGLVLESTAQNRRPNVVFVLADDLGWAELGCYGNGFNETPHLDRLAKQGVRFTHAYAAAPVCSPYRAALLTGQHPARVGITDYLRPNSSNGLPVSHVALPEILGKHDYTTGMVGKWHLTGYKHHEAEFELRPTDHGFGWNTGSEVKGVGNGANFFPYVFRTQPISWIDLPKNKLGKGEYLTDRLNHEAVEFIERNHQRPFFLYLSHYAPHTILNGKPDLVEKYLRKHPPGPSMRDRERCYLCKDSGMKGDACYHWASHHNPHLAAMLESIDDGIGMIDREGTSHWHLYFARGITRERQGNWIMAEVDLQKARQLSGDEPHVLNYLGYSWVDQGIYLKEGLAIIELAVRKEPSNGFFVDSLGWAHYRLGEHEKALGYLEHASRLEPTDPVITEHLGDVLWRLGREVEARYQWRKALAFNPIEEDRVKIESKLVTGLEAMPEIGPEDLVGGTEI